MADEKYVKALTADLGALRRCTQTKFPAVESPLPALTGLDFLSCLEAVNTQGVRHWELLTLMLSLHCRYLVANPLEQTADQRQRFTSELGAALKRAYPNAGLHELIRLATSEYDCSPTEPLVAIGFCDRLFQVLGPYAVHITAGPVTFDQTNRLFPVTPLFKKQLEYCFAYECLFPSSNKRVAKYRQATAAEFQQEKATEFL